MDLTAQQLVEQLNSLPQRGLAELRMRHESVWLDLSACELRAVSGRCVRADGRSGYGNLTMGPSAFIFDTADIEYVRHTEAGDR